MATALDLPLDDRRMERSRGAVRVWLYVIALLIVAMVAVGGATRLTDSGLSITEWKPIHGVIPPLSAAEWEEEFAAYRQIPEYQVINRGMSLEAFKGIYWWEWTHRFLGRFVGLAFLVPYLFFWATGRLERGLVPRLAGVFVLGGLQGAVGWWMVASGLSVRTDVSQYRLAVHLTLACVLLAWVLWIAEGLRPPAHAPPQKGRGLAVAIVALTFLQIFLGALVAGLDAGHASDTWPLMNGQLIPDGLFFLEPAWRNLFENALTVHFDHRLVGYVLLTVAIVHAVRLRGAPWAAGATALAILVALQACLGIANVLLGMPLGLALVHQLGAVAVLALATVHLRAMVPARPFAVPA